ncbi:MAG: hypothetical protein ACYC3W_07055 [Candidatus Nanopelagicales bacterium]
MTTQYSTQAEVLFGRTLAGRFEKNIVLVGPPISVLSGQHELVAQGILAGFCSISLEGGSTIGFSHTIAEQLVNVVQALRRSNSTSLKIQHALGVLANFVKAQKGSKEGAYFPQYAGIADSGQLELDLPELLECVADAAHESQTGILLSIIRMDALVPVELSAVLMSLHRTIQKQLPLILIGSGAPKLIKQLGEAKGYAERLFTFCTV